MNEKSTNTRPSIANSASGTSGSLAMGTKVHHSIPIVMSNNNNNNESPLNWMIARRKQASNVLVSQETIP